MAATTRVRTDNVFGTTTDNPLLIGATTLNSAGLANLAAVAGVNRAVITLDPNRVNGAPETVIVTAHTGSATSATITRGAEGTAARQHPSGTFWVHAATAADFGTDWALWTPSLTNLTVGNGTSVGRFTKVQTTVVYRYRFTFGSTSAVGTDPTFTLPAAPAAGYVAEQDLLGEVIVTDSGTANFHGIARFVSGSTVRVMALGVAGTYANHIGFTATVPMTWANGDSFSVYGTYETT